MTNPDWMENWCTRTEGLHKSPDGTWSSETVTDVSFPTNEQIELAQIEDRSYWFAHRNNIIANVVDLFPPPGPILDVGGGNGFVARGLMQRGHDTMVVEPGELGTLTCQLRGVPAVRAAFQDINPPKAGTAAIGLFDVLEHIEDDVSALRRMEETLMVGGMFYVAVPAYQRLWSQDDIDAGHYRRYTLPGLTKKLQECGFKVEYQTYFFASLVAPLFLVRTLPTILGRRPNGNAAQTASEHSLPKGIIGQWFARSFDKESQTVRQGRTVSFGTSCLVAARKVG